MNIAVLMGGISAERNVSFASGKAIAEALQSRGHRVVALDPALGANGVIDLATFQADAGREPTAQELAAFSPKSLLDCAHSPHLKDVDIVFLALHGKYGEDGYIQALLDMQGIRYTGSAMLSSTLAMSKLMSKRIFQSAGIPTPLFLALSSKSILEKGADYDLVDELRSELGDGLVIKPDSEGSTVGITIVPNGNVDEIKRGIELAATLGEIILVEQFIEGRELTVAVLGDETLPIIEIRTDTGFYDYAHKYTKGRTEYICPADVPPDVEDFVSQLALSAHEALGCRAYSRVDFRLNDEFQAFCLEVNTLPGMTGTSLVPKSAAAAGIEFGELCEKIIGLS
ncbi:MAG: D-alanine--D-alanine ligase [Ignavibacteria bacterium]|nr:D-alanine--D-alanine ligase [Ignavibacteria bacterium]